MTLRMSLRREVLGVVEAVDARRRFELAFEFEDVAGAVARQQAGADQHAAGRGLPLAVDLRRRARVTAKRCDVSPISGSSRRTPRMRMATPSL